MLTHIWSATDIIFCHFRPFFAILCNYWPQKLKFGKNVKNTWRYYPFTHVTINQNHMMYGSWDIKCKGQRYMPFCNFCGFCHFIYPLILLTNQKIKILKKWKKKPGDIIILHLCTTNDDHVMYGSWYIKWNRQNFLSFWDIVCSFTPP